MTEETKDIVLVTCELWSTLSTSDALLSGELVARGHRVRSQPWNAAPLTEFATADLVVLRSNWDYHHDLDAFTTWLDHIDQSGAKLHNSAGLIRDHLDKSYLHRLKAAGFRTPETLVTENFDVETVSGWMDDRRLDRVVIKPAWGASGHGVELIGRDDVAAQTRRWNEDPTRRPMLVQEFMPEVSNGETALVFFGGEFSHALLRQPGSGDFRVNSQYGGTMSHVADVEPDLIEFGAMIEASLPERPTYLRVDVVSDGADHTLMELEVNEPALGLDLAPGSAARFAAALVS